jgi:hypothetical protein
LTYMKVPLSRPQCLYYILLLHILSGERPRHLSTVLEADKRFFITIGSTIASFIEKRELAVFVETMRSAFSLCTGEFLQ